MRSAALLAALGLSILTACGSTREPPPADGIWRLEKTIAIHDISWMMADAREDAGLPSLDRSLALNAVAQERAQALAGIEPLRPGTSLNRVHARSHEACRATELVALRGKNATEAFLGWMSSNAHRATILSADATHYGFGKSRAKKGRNKERWVMVVSDTDC